MARLVFTFIWVMAMLGPALADGPWSGNWQVTWPKGGAFLQLEQDGAAIRGSYRSGQGRIEGTVSGNGVQGQILHDGIREEFNITLNPGLQSFSGTTAAGEWLSGIRRNGKDFPVKLAGVDLHSPRATLRSFLDAGNLARAGNPQALASAIDTIDFGSEEDWSASDAKYAAAEALFGLVDLATFHLATIPEQSGEQRLTLALPRLDKHTTVDITLQRGTDGKWRIVMPTAAALRAMARDLEGDSPSADNFRQLQSPRDTLRAFLDGMAHWDSGGIPEAMSTLDLSAIPGVLKDEQGKIICQYLVRIIDQVGHMMLQSVPNSGASREPFVYFEHPAGRIVIEPIGTGADTRWQFSSQTVNDARRLFSAVESLPEAHTLDPSLIPESSTFDLRNKVKAYAPALLKGAGGNGNLEYWQALGALLIASVITVIALVIKRMAAWLLARPAVRRHVKDAKHLPLAIGIALALISGGQLARHLGLPAATRQYSVPLIGSLMLLVISYICWQLITIISTALEEYAERTRTVIDNILITFVAGVARISLIAVAGLGFGHLWSLPTTGILAGLGIGGLAVAFASKETLANLFGAGILLGDRPFRKGDRVIAGEVNGWVEAVGLRSTRIRTLYDSLQIVPNGKLADTTINNLGARRHRSLLTTVLVTSGGTPERLQSFTHAIYDRISSDPLFDRHPEVNIIGIAANGIQVEISANFKTRRGFESRTATHKFLLDIMQLAEAQGLTLGRGMEKHPVYYLQEP